MTNTQYRYIYQYMKCPKFKINIYSKSIYKYNKERDIYQLIERTCDIEQRKNTKFKCNGTNAFGRPCFIINPPPLELSPTSEVFDLT